MMKFQKYLQKWVLTTNISKFTCSRRGNPNKNSLDKLCLLKIILFNTLEVYLPIICYARNLTNALRQHGPISAHPPIAYSYATETNETIT